MSLPTDPQVKAALRHVYTAAGTALTIASAIALFPQDQVQSTLGALHEIGDGLQQAWGGVSKLLIIIGPIIGAYAGKKAFSAAGFTSQLRSIFRQGQADQGKGEQIMVATANLDEVAKVVPKNPVVAMSIPNDKVTPA